MRTGVVLAGMLAVAGQAIAIDEEHYRQAREMIELSIEYLRSQQDAETGGWGVMPGGSPQLPAITSLVLTGMLMEPDISASDPAVSRGVDFVLSFANEDGSISDGVLANYNTSIALSALARVNTAAAGEAIEAGQAFLKRIQWSEDALEHPETGDVDADHPYYGGVGYGGSGRPDMSNLTLMLQGLRDSGLDCDDEAFQRALVFLSRTQMHGDVNDMAYAAGSTQGGFIYATSPNKDSIGVGESKAGTVEETLSDGTTASRLRAYGSMTYAGFKSYVYADLDRDDPRVTMAYDWIRQNYTLEENPGIGKDGLYYYFMTFSKALDAWGLPTISVFGEPVELSGTLDYKADGETHSLMRLSDREGNIYRLASPAYQVRVEMSPNGPMGETPVSYNINWPLAFADGREYVGVGVVTTDDTGALNRIEYAQTVRLGETRDWANDLIDRLAELQNPDGSFRVVDGRWMEDNPVLITSYALLALQHAVN
ncbi:MAG: prenyltransferase/squalene oxidase repeat-containing protein [Planctomycetota bacterium]